MPEKVQLSTPPAETLSVAELSEEAKPILRDDSTPTGFVVDLAKAGLYTDALKQLAHALGGRRCIGWSLASIRKLQPKPAEKEQRALATVEKWLAEPNDANRRAAQKAAEKAQISTPAGCVAMAVFFVEGSIAPPEAQDVPVPPHVAEKIAAAGIMLAVVGSEPEKADERYKQSLELGLGNSV